MKDKCVVQACSYLPPHTELEAGVFAGNPVRLTCPSKADPEYTPWMLTRLLLPVIFFCFSVGAAVGIGSLLPDVSAYRDSPAWSWEKLLVVTTYLAMYQLIGVCMLLTSVILKWSFISPFLTDVFADVAFNGFFIYLSKTLAIKYWCRLFGMTVGSDTIILKPGVCSASPVHRVIVGEGCLLVNCTLSPSQGPTVWSWLAGRDGSPWWGVESKQKSIRVGDGSQILLKSRIEDNVTVHKSCTIAAYTRIAKDTDVMSDTTAIGNPYTCQGKALVACKGRNVADKSSTDKITEPDTPTSAINVDVSGETCIGLASVKPTTMEKLHTKSTKGLVMTRSLLFLHTLLTILTIVVMGGGAILILLGLAALPIYGMHYIPRILLAVLYVLCCAIAYMWAFTWIAKWVLLGENHKRNFSMASNLGVRFLYLQSLQNIFGDIVLMPLFVGTFLNNLYVYTMGADVSILQNQLFTSCIEAADAHYLAIRPGAVFDRFSYVCSHRAVSGEVEMNRTQIMQNAVLHSCAGILLGSVGENTQLLPLTMPLREMHMGDDEVYMGAPANRVRTKAADISDGAEAV